MLAYSFLTRSARNKNTSLISNSSLLKYQHEQKRLLLGSLGTKKNNLSFSSQLTHHHRRRRQRREELPCSNRVGAYHAKMLHHRQQYRTYLFLPSDLSELQFRTSQRLRSILLNEKHDRTVYVKLMKAKKRCKQKYDKSKLFWNKSKTEYNASKAKCMTLYKESKNKYVQYYQMKKTKYACYIQQKQEKIKERSVQNKFAAALEIGNKITPYYASKFAMPNHIIKRKPGDSAAKSVARAIMKRIPIQITEYSKEEWFDPVDGRPLTAKDPSGRFVNPWLSQSTNGVHSVKNILKWRWQRLIRNYEQHGLLSAMIPSILSTTGTSNSNNGEQKINSSTASSLPLSDIINNTDDDTCNSQSNNDIQFTWIGHATCLLKMCDVTILIDPMFAHRASPYQSLPVGVPRDLPPAYDIDSLLSKNSIDICLISHDHYDHLDKDSCIRLKEIVKLWIVPLGTKELLTSQCNIPSSKIIECEWWQNVTYNNNVRITCCPAQHWCGRTFWDRNKRLWCSYAVQGIQKIKNDDPNDEEKIKTVHSPNFYFAGDSGVPPPKFDDVDDIKNCENNVNKKSDEQGPVVSSRRIKKTPAFPLFEQIGDIVGPFDLAALPIGAYEPSFLMKEAHMNPEEAIHVHNAIRSKKSIAIHYGSFQLSEESHNDPPKWLTRKVNEINNKSGSIEGNSFDDTSKIIDFVTMPHGGTIKVDCDHSFNIENDNISHLEIEKEKKVEVLQENEKAA